jgi:hypothetical protein
MQKTAQERGFINKLREMTNISGRAAEKFFNPEFLKIMESLRKTDDDIRSIATGKQIKDGSVGKDHISLKQLLKDAKSNCNKREYMAAVADLSRFNNKMKEIVAAIHSLDASVDAVHAKFLFQGLQDSDPDRLEQLRQLSEDYKKSKNKKANYESDQFFIKEASIRDWIYGVANKRGKSLAFWEKRYPKLVGKLKEETLTILNKSNALYNQLLVSLDEMAKYRAERNVGNKKEDDIKSKEENNKSYFGAATKIVHSYNAYNTAFMSYYETAVLPYIEKYKLFQEQIGEKPSEKSLEQDVGATPSNIELATGVGAGGGAMPSLQSKPSESVSENIQSPTVVTQDDTAPDTSRTGKPEGMSVVQQQPVPEAESKQLALPGGVSIPVPGGGSAGAAPSGRAQREEPKPRPKMPQPSTNIAPAPVAKTKEEKEKEAIRQMQIAKGITVTHAAFYESLQSMSNESPLILASYINKYARAIQGTDPATSIKLFGISRAIRK